MPTHGICEKPTRKYPEGRTGTNAGYGAHRYAKEEACEPCLKAQKKYREENIDKARESSRRSMRKSYWRNPGEARKKSTEWRDKNREKNRARDRDYYQNNKELYRHHKRSRMLREVSVPSDRHTAEMVTETHGSICYLCETKVDLDKELGWNDSREKDHVVPLTHPGTPGDVIDNVRWTHSLCNNRKGNRLVENLLLPFEPPVPNKTAWYNYWVETLKEKEI